MSPGSCAAHCSITPSQGKRLESAARGHFEELYTKIHEDRAINYSEL